MSKSEMRFLRREIIGVCLHSAWYDGTKYGLFTIKTFVRMSERNFYSQELKAYA